MTIAQKENRLINGKKIEEPDMTLHTSEYLKFDKMLEIHWKKKDSIFNKCCWSDLNE